MADSEPHFAVLDEDDSAIVSRIEDFIDALSPALTGGRIGALCVGFTFAVYGGKEDVAGTPTEVANETFDLSAFPSTTVYLYREADGTRVITDSIPAGWPGPLAAGARAAYTLVTGVAGITSHTDHRTGGSSVTGGVGGIGDVVGPVSAVNNRVVFFDGTTGKVVKDSGLALSGANTGDQTSVSGNAGTATALQTARTIGGVSFDGTANIAQPFDASAFYPGVPTSSAIVLRVPVARAVSFVANFVGSQGAASVAATASTAFDITKNGSSIGTATFALGATTATFVSAGGTSQSLAAGDVLAIVAPGTPDASLANIGFALAGTR